jgi:hypothetical protein
LTKTFYLKAERQAFKKNLAVRKKMFLHYINTIIKLFQHKKKIARFFLTALLVNVTVSVLCSVGVDVRNLTGKPQQTVVKKHHGAKPCKCPNKKNCCSEQIAKFNKLEKKTGEAIVINHITEDLAFHPPVAVTILNLFENNTSVKPVARWVIPPPHSDIRVFIQSFLI